MILGTVQDIFQEASKLLMLHQGVAESQPPLFLLNFPIGIQ